MDEKREKLFILEKEDTKAKCWSTFQKTDEIQEFEKFKEDMLKPRLEAAELHPNPHPQPY